MTGDQLVAACQGFDKGDDLAFTTLVGGAVGHGLTRALASAMEVSLTTVERWASGVARPSRAIRPMIVREIAKLGAHR